MNQKELTETFMMISNSKNPLVSIVYTKIFQRCNGLDMIRLTLSPLWYALSFTLFL